RVVGNTAHRPRQNSGDHLLELSGLACRICDPLLLLPNRRAFVRSVLIDKPVRRREKSTRQRRKAAPIVEPSAAGASGIVRFPVLRRHHAPHCNSLYFWCGSGVENSSPNRTTRSTGLSFGTARACPASAVTKRSQYAASMTCRASCILSRA